MIADVRLKQEIETLLGLKRCHFFLLAFNTKHYIGLSPEIPWCKLYILIYLRFSGSVLFDLTHTHNHICALILSS